MKLLLIGFLLVLAATFFSSEENYYLPYHEDAVSPTAIQFVNFRHDIIKYLQNKNNHKDGLIEYENISNSNLYNNNIWNARILSDICYIWGISDKKVYLNIFNLLSYSMSLGIAKDGKILIRDHTIPCPDFIPEGSLVSLIQLS